MKEIFKIKYLDINGGKIRNNSWEFQKYSNYSRIVIAPEKNFIYHLLNIIKKAEPPYRVLFVLSVPRVGKEGRYQIQNPLTYQELESLLVLHQEFFEKDSRFELWIGTLSGDILLVYDRHDVIYAYNSDELVKGYLHSNSFSEEEIKIPFPHEHRFYAEYDHFESELLENYDWIRFELEEQDRQ